MYGHQNIETVLECRVKNLHQLNVISMTQDLWHMEYCTYILAGLLFDTLPLTVT